MSDYHTSVLLKEAVDFLNVAPGRRYIDATLGGGGHTLEIARRGGEVLSLDVDEEAISNFGAREADIEAVVRKRILVKQANFEHLDEIAGKNDFDNVSGVL